MTKRHWIEWSAARRSCDANWSIYSNYTSDRTLYLYVINVAVHDGLDGEFTLLDFKEAQSIAYAEIQDGAIYVQSEDRVSKYTMTRERMCAATSIAGRCDPVSSGSARGLRESEEHAMPVAERLTFQPSSYTGGGSNCLEAAPHQDGVVIRDSKDPSGPTIEFTHAQWARFIEETRQSHTTKLEQPNTNGAVITSTEKMELIYNGETKLTCWHLRALASESASAALHRGRERSLHSRCRGRRIHLSPGAPTCRS